MENIDYSDFYCALAEDQHFIEAPISLSCGHSICKDCIPAVDPSIVCKICNKQNIINLAVAEENLTINKLISLKLAELFQCINIRIRDSRESLKGLIN
jgi:hypothetical protein